MKYDGYQRGLASNKKSQGSRVADNNVIKQNIQLADELHQLLENLRKDDFIHHLEIVFGVLIWLICNY